MAIYIELLACKRISDAVRHKLERAGCPIHKNVLWGEFCNVEIVELHHTGEDDYDVQEVGWEGEPERKVLKAIQIQSLSLDLLYLWDDNLDGYELISEDGDTYELVSIRLLDENKDESDDQETVEETVTPTEKDDTDIFDDWAHPF